LGVSRETELIGAGVSYCATCDGAFFRGRDVAVVGGGNTALEDATFLSNYCSKVYVIHRRDQFRGDERDVERLREKENVEFVLDSVVESILGESMVEGIEVKNVKTGDVSELKIGGLFIAVGQMPDNSAFSGMVSLDSGGYIVAGEDCKTGTDGVFVAGDCRTKTVRQLTTAASDGAVAALAAAGYIDSL
ncbi:MAG: FAD-dependent oxidoreductase, partial [Eubacterium sp.]|nr:FAD-dependent oxidoreductase [Eubacterium sp.]